MTESKKCKTGYYYCFTDKKCKKIPMGYHIGARGYLARDNDEDSEEGKKNGNGKNGPSNGNGGTNGGSNGGNGGVSEGTLHKWFKGSKSKDGKGGWVNVVTGGTCASDEPGEGTPKCVSSAKRASMSKAERKSAARRKKEADPGQQQKSGAAKPTYVATDSKRKKVDEEAVSKKQQRFFGMVRAAQKGEMENPSPEVAKVAATAKRSDVKKFASTKHKGLPMKKVEESISEAKDKKGKGSGTKDACYHKVKSRYSVWPSAYASGALVKCRKVGAANWGNKSEEFEMQEKTAHSGSVTFSSKSVPAKATDDSIKSAVSKALAKPGTSHSASSEKGRRENKVGVNYSMSYSSGGDKKKEKNKDKKDKKKPVLKKKDGGHGDPGKPNKPSSSGGGGRNRSGSGGGGGSKLRSGGGSETRPSASRTGGSTLSRGTSSSSGGRALMRNSFTDLRDILDEKCWKGYEKKGMKTMFGKRYPNCVKKEDVEQIDEFASKSTVERIKRDRGNVPSFGTGGMTAPNNGGLKGGNEHLRKGKKTTKEEAEMVRYCPKCEKNETRDECSYGPKTWDMYSVPANLGPNTFEEKYERIQRLGKTYTVFFTFRGQYKSLQFFFPTSARPSREEVLIQLRKIYPEAVLTNYFERDRVENEPLVQVEGAKSFEKFIGEGRSVYGSGQLRPYDLVRTPGGLKSLNDIDKEIKAKQTQKKGVKEDWQSVNKKDKTDGMSPKAVAAYRRENPGSKLKTAVTGDPKPGSKDAKRRKSYCARSKGQQDMHNIDCSKTPDKPVCKARKRWKC